MRRVHRASITEKTLLHIKAHRLAVLTIAYNVIEGILSIGAGYLSQNISLVGFGLDSFVESLSAVVILWRFRSRGDQNEAQEEAREKKATRLVGVTFLILGLYVVTESIRRLLEQQTPEVSLPGMLILILSLLIMPTLYIQKRNVSLKLQSPSQKADSKQTLACIGMSATVLLGQISFALFGIWWIDAVTGIIIALYLFYEGYQALTKKILCAC